MLINNKPTQKYNFIANIGILCVPTNLIITAGREIEH
jgi:hypothetical protein